MLASEYLNINIPLSLIDFSVYFLTGLWWIQLVAKARSFLRPPYQLEHIVSIVRTSINTLEIYVKQSEQLTGPETAQSQEVSRFGMCICICVSIYC